MQVTLKLLKTPFAHAFFEVEISLPSIADSSTLPCPTG